ncbi:P-II family nitrogen regulator [Peribacillus cavernae]|uniref:P-II family nitrogen regulator n=1 Tax=Peribacillus cavernae TaxID=1674310 RepID=A0A3S0VY12_9BACI|nr:P-II family nitrogen regulator [Peribacillus cavernae]MDQ0219120.1 nitrogen regulatory protein P-II 1 [Peribacillus cavernae]RUQ28647.1 P-II family nitrogen regulator [Peribacillus cavernae]
MVEVLTKIEIVTRPNKFEQFKQELAKIGVSGITVSEVKGTGLQKGYIETYRGTRKEITLHDRIKIEIVVCEVPVQDVIDIARTYFNTGQPGDGKILIYELANVIKIRTGEVGHAALKNNN